MSRPIVASRCILRDTGEDAQRPHVHATDYITGEQNFFHFKTPRGKIAAWTRAQTFLDAQAKHHADLM